MTGEKKILSIHGQPLITIIIVTFNAGKHLQNCINSVSKNNYKNIELLVFDGASTDNTIDILKANESKVNYWQSEPDKGIYDAMNKAVLKASGKWILFLGADDKLADEFADVIPYLKDENCIYYGDYISNGKRYGGKFSSYRLAKANFCQQNLLYCKKVFDKYRFSLKYPISADHLLNMQCWADKDFRFEYHSIIFSDFAYTGISSTNTDIALEKDRESLIKKYLGYPVLIRYFFRIAKHKLKKMFNKKSSS